MSARIPPDGAHARCVRAAVDGIAAIEDCRQLARQAAGFVVAAGGVVIDHHFVWGPADCGLRLWASREDLVTFAAGMRASLRCLVDRPGRLASNGLIHRAAPRVEVNVALAPPPDPLSRAVLEQLDGSVDPARIAGIVCAIAEGRSAALADVDAGLIGQARSLLRLKPEGVALSIHLMSLYAKFGVHRPAEPGAWIGAVTSPDAGVVPRLDS